MARTKNKKGNIESPSLLYKEYDWYEKLFPLAMQKSSDDFFLPGLKYSLIGISKNINLLQTKEPHFVTKVRIDKFYDMYLRISASAMEIMLNKGLGKAGRPFNIEKVPEIEKLVLTGFSEYVSKIFIPFLEPPPVVNFVRTNFDMTHLTFLVKDEENDKVYGRFIASVPDGRLAPNKIESLCDKFDYEDFYECNTTVKISIGKTRFSVADLKSLEKGDLVVLEDSDINSFTLFVQGETKIAHIQPNYDIEIPFNENNGGDEMAEKAAPKNLWDSIEVDMYAELDAVKISLGNLKQIEIGQVVDVADLYSNKVTLRVENKIIGHGELVIINDKYGVKISDICQNKSEVTTQNVEQELSANEENNAEPVSNQAAEQNEEGETPAEQQAEEDEEFDYSDFELEDEDI